MTHDSYGGSIGPAMTSDGIRWMSAAEDVGRMSGPAGTSAARGPLRALAGQPTPLVGDHELDAQLRRGRCRAGVARARTRIAALVFAELRDHTPPIVRLANGNLDGRTVSWTWTGADVLLQTHSSRLCHFDVEYRVDAGPWRLLKSRTGATSLTLAGRSSGRTYAIRVRASDCLGNVSSWTPIRAVSVR